MKVVYDRHSDSLTIVLRPDIPMGNTDKSRPGVILGLDAEGNVIVIEVLDASQRVKEPDRVQFRVDS